MYNRTINHIKRILKHKNIVFRLCVKTNYIKIGLLHDLSKFSFVEMKESIKYYNSKSPIDEAKKQKGYSVAWQNHKGRNPHHWEYWIDNLGTKENLAIRMPFDNVIEMFFDMVSAGKIYEGEKWKKESANKFYQQRKYVILLHEDSRKLIETLLINLEKEGLNLTLKKIKKEKQTLKKTYYMDIEEKYFRMIMSINTDVNYFK